MSGPAALHHIEDPFGFARAAEHCSGQLALAALSRLQDRLSSNAGVVSYIVRGGLDERERPLLKLKIAADLGLRCDRCLLPLVYPLALNSRVLLARPGEVPVDDDDPETPEWIEALRDLDLQELVEEEILLGLPLAVRHDRGNCVPAGAGAIRQGENEAPFAKLADLLKVKAGRADRQ